MRETWICEELMILALRLLYEKGMVHGSQGNGLKGFITEAQLHLAEPVFPGITGFYRGSLCKPQTFLELVWQFERRESALTLPAQSPRTRDSEVPLSLHT